MLLSEAKQILKKNGFSVLREPSNYEDELSNKLYNSIIDEIDSEGEIYLKAFAPYLVAYLTKLNNKETNILNMGKKMLLRAISRAVNASLGEAVFYERFLKYGEPKRTSDIVEDAKAKIEQEEAEREEAKRQEWLKSDAHKHANDPGWTKNGHWELD